MQSKANLASPQRTLANCSLPWKGNNREGAPSGAVAIVNLQGNFVVAEPGAVRGVSRGEDEGPRPFVRIPIAKKLAAGKAGGKPDLAQGSIPDFAAPDAKAAAEKLRQRLA